MMGGVGVMGMMGGEAGGMMGGGFTDRGMMDYDDRDDDGVESWALIVALIVVTGAFSAVLLIARRPCEREPGALDMLAKRFARGELSAEEYSKTKRLLEGGPTMIASALLLLADSGGHMDWHGGWWIVMVLGMALFWGLVILGIVWIVRELGHPRAPHGQGPDDATAILDRRLASGEISPEEYEERRAVLRGGSPPS